MCSVITVIKFQNRNTYLIRLAWIVLFFSRLLFSYFSLEEDIMRLDAIISCDHGFDFGDELFNMRTITIVHVDRVHGSMAAVRNKRRYN